MPLTLLNRPFRKQRSCVIIEVAVSVGPKHFGGHASMQETREGMMNARNSRSLAVMKGMGEGRSLVFEDDIPR